MNILINEIKELSGAVANLQAVCAITQENTERVQESLLSAGLVMAGKLPVVHGNAKQSFLTSLDLVREHPAEPAHVLAALEAIGLLL
jgi:hypothetical protein